MVPQEVQEVKFSFKLKFVEMRSATCNGNALFAENKLYELYKKDYMKIRGLSV